MIKPKRVIASLLVLLIGSVAVLFKPEIIFAFVLSTNDSQVLLKEHADMVPLYWTMGIIGGCIVLTLFYVSWKKFKVEKRKQVKKDTNS